jgi:hypothetical protein
MGSASQSPEALSTQDRGGRMNIGLYVGYEIVQSHNRGNGMLGIYIHKAVK